MIESETQCDFAASDDKTGNPSEPGVDWVMESDDIDIAPFYFFDTSEFDGSFAAESKGLTPEQVKKQIDALQAEHDAKLLVLQEEAIKTIEDEKRAAVEATKSTYEPQLESLRLQHRRELQDAIAARENAGRELETMGHQHERGVRLIAGAPIIEAEVIFAARYDWAMHANDFIARRTRLAFIDKTAAVNAIDRVVELMANELKWDKNRCDAEKEHCYEYLQHFGGPEPLQEGIASIGSSNNHIKSTIDSTYGGVKKDEIIMNDNHNNGISRGGLPRERYATYFELSQVFDSIDSSNKGSISQEDLMRVAMLLGTPLTKDQVKNCVEACDTDGDGRISKGEFIVWWNSTAMNPELREMTKRSMATGNIEGSGTVFG